MQYLLVVIHNNLACMIMIWNTDLLSYWLKMMKTTLNISTYLLDEIQVIFLIGSALKVDYHKVINIILIDLFV